jgi:micrococcal nuclease
MSPHRPKIILSGAAAILVVALGILIRQVVQYLPPVQIALPDLVTSTFVASPSVSSTGEWFVVKRVVDGDTIELEDGTKVRYVGVNTPETHHPTKGVQCFGKEAAAFNQELVVEKRVRLVKDVSETDRYGRLLRFVYLEDGTLVNQVLLEKGYAQAMTYPPDVKMSKQFLVLQQQARQEKRGLWGFCSSTKF